MNRWQSRRQNFRKLLAQSGCVSPASVHDPVSARIAEHLGFEVGIFAGSVASLTVLGAPDIILLTMTEFAQQAMRISRASELPVLVDADHGYGNAMNVMRCVEELEAAGIAALSIEDTELPSPAGSGGVPRLTSIQEGVGKMKAALAARRDPDLVIAGRTSAASISDPEDAAQRALAYEKAGVDVLFLVGVKDSDALRTITSVTTLPVILGSAGADLKDPAVLASNRVRICLQGHQPFAAATQAIYDTMKRLRDGESPSELPNLASAELMQMVTHGDEYKQWAARFLDGKS
ncbi:MAG: isocitrate lyase/PEP mutase family protein [Burkholderiaceae bacterium]